MRVVGIEVLRIDHVAGYVAGFASGAVRRPQSTLRSPPVHEASNELRSSTYLGR